MRRSPSFTTKSQTKGNHFLSKAYLMQSTEVQSQYISSSSSTPIYQQKSVLPSSTHKDQYSQILNSLIQIENSQNSLYSYFANHVQILEHGIDTNCFFTEILSAKYQSFGPLQQNKCKKERNNSKYGAMKQKIGKSNKKGGNKGTSQTKSSLKVSYQLKFQPKVKNDQFH